MKSLLEKLNALVLFALFGVVAAAVGFRTLLGMPASWSEELGQYAFIFLVFIGSAAAMLDGSHIAITTFVDRCGPRGRRNCRLLQRSLAIPFLIVFAYGAWSNVDSNWGLESPTVAWMNVGYMYLCVMLASLVMCGCLVRPLLRDLRHDPIGADPDEASPPP